MRNDSVYQLKKFDTNPIRNSKMADKIASVIAHCISPYASFNAGLSCNTTHACMLLRMKTYYQLKTEVKKKPRTYNKLIDLLKCVVLSSVSISEHTKYRSHPNRITRLLAASVHDVLYRWIQITHIYHSKRISGSTIISLSHNLTLNYFIILSYVLNKHNMFARRNLPTNTH